MFIIYFYLIGSLPFLDFHERILSVSSDSQLINTIFPFRYVEQLVASAEAAVEEVIRRGVSSFTISDIILYFEGIHNSQKDFLLSFSVMCTCPGCLS